MLKYFKLKQSVRATIDGTDALFNGISSPFDNLVVSIFIVVRFISCLSDEVSPNSLFFL